jgi:hypothetical protein
VGDELVTGAAQLVGVPLAGELEGVANRRAVDLGCRVELLDNGEEVGQELLVLYGCLCASRYCRAS